MKKIVRQWLGLFVYSSWLLVSFASPALAGKSETLWYTLFQNGVQVGYQKVSFQTLIAGTENLRTIDRLVKIKETNLFSANYNYQLDTHTVLEGSTVISHSHKSKEYGQEFKGTASSKLKGYNITVTSQDKQFTGEILFSAFDCTDFSLPDRYINRFGTGITRVNLLDWQHFAVVPTEFHYLRRDTFATLTGKVSTLVIARRNQYGDRIDWITEGGILLQSSGKNERGTFLLKASSKQQALARH